MNSEIILMQDDCAPDSMEYFEEKFKEITGLTLEEFKEKAFRGVLQMGYVWRHKCFILEWFCDDPFYVLIKN